MPALRSRVKTAITFVNINSATNQTTRVPLSSTEQVLTISKVEGGFNIGRTVGNKTFYVHHADKQQYDIQELPPLCASSSRLLLLQV